MFQGFQEGQNQDWMTGICTHCEKYFDHGRFRYDSVINRAEAVVPVDSVDFQYVGCVGCVVVFISDDAVVKLAGLSMFLPSVDSTAASFACASSALTALRSSSFLTTTRKPT